MGDEKDTSAQSTEHVASAPALAPSGIAPRPVSVVPRPSGAGTSPLSRMPPPPSARGFGPLGAGRSGPPPPPVRHPPAADALGPRPSQPLSSRPPFNGAPSATAQLEQRLGIVQLELRKLGSERHTLRARLRRALDRGAELESALRAEQELRRQLSEEHQVALSGMRARLKELESERDREIARLSTELAMAERAPAEAAALVAREQEAPRKWAKPPEGLRRIRGIGPAYQRVLEQLGVSQVEQVAAWTDADIALFANKLKIKRERILKDDWVGQARRLVSPELG